MHYSLRNWLKWQPHPTQKNSLSFTVIEKRKKTNPGYVPLPASASATNGILGWEPSFIQVWWVLIKLCKLKCSLWSGNLVKYLHELVIKYKTLLMLNKILMARVNYSKEQTYAYLVCRSVFHSSDVSQDKTRPDTPHTVPAPSSPVL